MYNNKSITTNQRISNGSNSSNGKSNSSRSSSTSTVKKKDESPPVTPDSTTEPPPRPTRPFQEGDDVFFHTDDGQLVLGNVGQIIGQTCQVLFGDGTKQWASFKRLKKLTATFDEDDTAAGTNTSTNTSRGRDTIEKKTNTVLPKEETVELLCATCGVKKKISVSKARTFKPEGPNVFKCRKCNKLPAETSSHIHQLNPFLKLPAAFKTQSSVIRSSALLQNMNGITIPTASGSLSIFRQDPPPQTVKTKESDTKVSSVINKNIKLNQPSTSTTTSTIQSRSKSSVCFSCEKSTESDDHIACNLCGRFCHLNCLPLKSPPPPKGDKFWDLMCSSCGTQNSENNSRSRVFSVRRNISSWTDIAYMVLNCLSIENPSQHFFDLDTEILQFLETNIINLKLPRNYAQPEPADRKKYILHALYSS